MSTFICEKCGCIDNSACNNNYWSVHLNEYLQKKNKPIEQNFTDEFTYFETHKCCSECCKGVEYIDHSGVLSKGWHNRFPKEHWTKYGKEKLLELESYKKGDMENATEFFKNIKEI